MKKRNRLEIYQTLYYDLFSIVFRARKMDFSFGLAHGDCSPDNIITTQDGLSFLDFDSIKSSFQLFDLTDLLLKYSDAPNKAAEIKIIKEYIKVTNFYDLSELNYLYDLISLISCYRGIEMALSTEYYCYIKRKFSPDVMDSLFLHKVLLLTNNVRKRIEEFKRCKEKSPEHIVEYMDILKTATVLC